MNRRDLLARLGGAVLPLAAALAPSPMCAQQMPVIGFMHAGSLGPSAAQVEEFRKGLAETGAVDGRNVAIEYRWAEGRYDRLPALAADLVARRVDVLLAGGGPAAMLAAKAATTITPTVFVSGDDPVRHGVVASLARPGGNMTGAAFFCVSLVGKRLEVLRELVPAATSFAYLNDPGNPEMEHETRDVLVAARALGRDLQIVSGRTDAEFEAVFAELAARRIGGLVVACGPQLFIQRAKLIALSARYRIPAVYNVREYVAEGGLLSYGNNIPDSYRQAGLYAGRILKGAKPAELPVVQSTKFDLTINLKTAKALGLDVPLIMQQRADEVIE
jgi:putative ABC transport system substrate-binding protein